MRAQAIQQAPFRVLIGANMPAVLVEMGFISNPAEEKLLNSPRYQQAIVDALVDSIARFRDQLDARAVPVSVTSGRRGCPSAARAARQPRSRRRWP